VRDFREARQALDQIMDGDAYAASFAAPLDRVAKDLFARHGQQAIQAIAGEIATIARK